MLKRSVPTIASSPHLLNPLLPTVVIAREFKKADGVTAGAFTSRYNTILNHLACFFEADENEQYL